MTDDLEEIRNRVGLQLRKENPGIRCPKTDDLEEIRNRVGRLEDHYLNLALKVEAISTKMNILGIIGTVTLGSTVTILIAVFFHL